MTEAAIGAAWPRWWSDEADASQSARLELRFTVARQLGLDPTSLVEDGSPRFLWKEEARFKHLAGESEDERAGLGSFGRAVAAALLSATPPSDERLRGVSASELRSVVLTRQRPFVSVDDLLAIAWGLGIPVAHLRVFPWERKRMAAMAVGVGDRAAALLAKDSAYPAPIAFYLAHELGHIALGHVSAERFIVDLEDDEPALAANDAEEQAADAFALELLTGEPEPRVVLAPDSARATARELARIALEAGPELRIEPGVLALCFGYSTTDWRTAYGAVRLIYGERNPVWEYVNEVALAQLELGSVSIETADFVRAVLGRQQHDG